MKFSEKLSKAIHKIIEIDGKEYFQLEDYAVVDKLDIVHIGDRNYTPIHLVATMTNNNLMGRTTVLEFLKKIHKEGTEGVGVWRKII